MIKRFTPIMEHEPYGCDYATMMEDIHGEYVRYSDIEHLLITKGDNEHSKHIERNSRNSVKK